MNNDLSIRPFNIVLPACGGPELRLSSRVRTFTCCLPPHQMTFNPTGSDRRMLPNNQLTAASLSSRKLFSRCQGSFGCLMPWWTKSHAIEYWENRGRRILWVMRQLQIDCPRAFDFARTLLKLYFRTPTMFASLLESCMADLATFCGITIPSDVTKFPSMCDIPQDVIGTCADVSIGGTSNEK